MKICKCGDGLNNTGVPGCLQQIAYGVGVIMVPTYASDGTLNQIDITDTLDAAYVTAALNNTDASKRWYPIMNVKNIENKVGAPEFEEFDDKTKVRVFDGIRTFKGIVPLASPHYVGKIDSASCEQASYYIIGKDGSIQGSDAFVGFLTPFKISKGSLVAQYEFATPKTTAKAMFEWVVDFSEADENVSYISASEFSNYNFLTLNGLLDCSIEFTSVHATSAVLKISTEYGSVITKSPIEGLLSANFFDHAGGTASKVYDVTGSAAVSIVSVTESPAGTYTITYASQTVTDILRFTPVRNGIICPPAQQAIT